MHSNVDTGKTNFFDQFTIKHFRLMCLKELVSPKFIISCFFQLVG